MGWTFCLDHGMDYVCFGRTNQHGFLLRVQVSLSAFSFLFSELVQYNQTQVDNIAELERRYVFFFFSFVHLNN